MTVFRNLTVAAKPLGGFFLSAIIKRMALATDMVRRAKGRRSLNARLAVAHGKRENAASRFVTDVGKRAAPSRQDRRPGGLPIRRRVPRPPVGRQRQPAALPNDSDAADGGA